jgi:hypothetical protein
MENENTTENTTKNTCADWALLMPWAVVTCLTCGCCFGGCCGAFKPPAVANQLVEGSDAPDGWPWFALCGMGCVAWAPCTCCIACCGGCGSSPPRETTLCCMQLWAAT